MPKNAEKQKKTKPEPKATQPLDPFRETKTERETPTMEELHPNPLAEQAPSSAPSSPDSPSSALQPASGKPPSEPQPERLTADQAKPACRLVLGFVARFTDPERPPTDDEVQSVAEPAAEGLPPWLFHWSIRLLGSLWCFVESRMSSAAEKAAKQPKPPTPQQPPGMQPTT
jgi:hypothetical protein